MSLDIDQANEVINDQEEIIADLRQKLLEMEDLRDLAIGKALELVTALQRVECAIDHFDTFKTVKDIARTAIDAYQAK